MDLGAVTAVLALDVQTFAARYVNESETTTAALDHSKSLIRASGPAILLKFSSILISLVVRNIEYLSRLPVVDGVLVPANTDQVKYLIGLTRAGPLLNARTI